MKVKIGNKIYDSRKQPIMLILTEEEKDFIASMRKGETKFCSYPHINYWIKDNCKNIKKWMAEHENNQ